MILAFGVVSSQNLRLHPSPMAFCPNGLRRVVITPSLPITTGATRSDKSSEMSNSESDAST